MTGAPRGYLPPEQARRAAVDWAISTLRNPQVVFVDTETTGLGNDAQIVDIALIDLNGNVLFESLVRPQGRIPSEVISIHGITDAMVAQAPQWGDVYPTVRRILSAGNVVVYNADFDYRMLNQMNARYGFPRYQARWDCAMQKYGAWAGQWNAKYGNYRWHKLDSALLTFGHPIASHRAADDARACRLVVMGMANATSRPQPGDPLRTTPG